MLTLCINLNGCRGSGVNVSEGRGLGSTGEGIEFFFVMAQSYRRCITRHVLSSRKDDLEHYDFEAL